MKIVGKVRWAFLFALAVTVGLTALLFMLQFDNLIGAVAKSGSQALLGQLTVAAVIGGFIGGLVSHEPKRGFFSALILIIFVFGTLLTLHLIDFLSGARIVTRYYVDFGSDPAISPQGEGDFMLGYTVLYWFLPGMFIAGALIPTSLVGGFLSRKYVKIKPKRPGVRGKEKRKSLMQIFSKPLFLLIFVLAWLPVVVPLFSQDDNVYKDFSAWNTGESGTSQFRQMLEDQGYTNIKSCITSYSMLSKLDEPFVLVALGPNRFYNPIVDLPSAMKILSNNGSMLVAHDHGTTDYLMWWMYFASLPMMEAGETSSTFPLTLFPKGVLRDNVSYYKENLFPVANMTSPHATTNGVSKLVLNHACGLLPMTGWTTIVGTNPTASWIDVEETVETSSGTVTYPDGNGSYDATVDFYKLSYDNIFKALGWFADILDIDELDVLSDFLDTEIPLGGFSIPVAAVSEFGNGSRIVCTSDASMFSNQLIDIPQFDNGQFAMNSINWLAKNNKSTLIIFDEAHLAGPGQQDLSAPGIYGQYLDYVGWLSSNWFIAPFYPFIALLNIRRLLPKSEEQKRKERLKRKRKQEKKEKRLQRKMKRKRKVLSKLEYRKPGKKTTKFTQKKIEGVLRKSTYFVQKLNWYLEQSEYNRALELLYNRVRRLIGKKFGAGATTDDVIHAIIEQDPTHDHKELTSFFSKMKRILKKKGTGRLRIWKQEQFERIYYQMVGITQHLETL